MKPTASLRFLLGCPIIALLAAPRLQAANYFWDDNAAGAGFGTAGANLGTWAAPTAGPTAGWSLSGTGANAFASFTTTAADTVNFGNGATGLAAGTITVSGTVNTGNMTFASGSGAITLSGGIISLGGGRIVTANNTGNVISSELALTGASIFRIGEIGSSATRQLTLGVLSGTGGTTFEYAGGTNGTGLILLNGESTYTGNTLISTTLTNANTEVRLGVDNALPTTTVLTIGGVAGTGTAPGRKTQLNLNGNDQTLAGLATTGGGTLRTQNILSSTAATLTIDGTTSNTFAGLIGNGGTNISIVKAGSGTQTFSGANTYVGTTQIQGGVINIQHATALGSAAGGTSVSAGAALQIQNGITVASEALTLNGTGITNTGALRSISGTNNYNGAITLGSDSQISSDAGTLALGGGITGTGFGLTIAGAGATTLSTTGINTGAGGSLTKNNGGALTLNAASDYTGLTTINGGAVLVQNANALGTTAGGTVVNGSNSGSVSNARLELAGGVTVTGESLTISGAGNFVGALTSSSGNNVWAGPVTIGLAQTRLGASAGASLEVSGVIDSGAVTTGLVIRATDMTSTVILSGANTYLGTTQVIIGKLQLAGGDNRLPTGNILTLGSSGTNPDAEFDLNGRNQEVAGLNLTGSGVATKNSVNNSSLTASTLTVNTAAASPSTYTGKLDGNLALTKTGSDTLTLTGTNNTYSGATNVNQGTLIVDGNISTSILTTVASGATIAGSGTVAALNVEAGGFVAPGNSPGILNTGDYTQAGTYNAEINGLTAGTDHDQINVTGTVNITGGSLNLTSFTGTYTANDLIFILLNDLSDSITGTYTGLAQGAVVATYGGFDWQISYLADSVGGTFSGGNDIALMAVPEPAAALLGGLGSLLLLRRRRV